MKIRKSYKRLRLASIYRRDAQYLASSPNRKLMVLFTLVELVLGVYKHSRNKSCSHPIIIISTACSLQVHAELFISATHPIYL